MMDRVPKLNGADIELGNFVLGRECAGDTSRDNTCYEASHALLREIPGIGGAGAPRAAWVDPQDYGRKFLPTNGGCAYIDLDHLELCLPEVLSAYDHVAAWHAQLRLAQVALASANAALSGEQRIQALVNNSDGLGNSYGSHLDVLITRQAWNDLFQRRPHYQAYLAAYQVSSIVFTGQGKVGSENGMPGDGYQISQRADMIVTLTGQQTTYRRPLLNTRDEPLCGSRWRPRGAEAKTRWLPLGDSLARLHVIFYDNTLCQTACLLKVGVMQVILAMLEARAVDVSLALDDPLLALWVWSRDHDLRTPSALAAGGHVTAVQLQRRFAEDARRFVESGGCDGFVPRAGEILDLWEDTLDRLERRDFDTLARRLDWVLKHSILERVLDGQGDLDWSSPELKHLDLAYSNLDPSEGLFWAYASAGALDEPVPAARIEHFRHNPPDDTRAWGRAMWLRKAGVEGTASVDWDRIEIRVPGTYQRAGRTIPIDLSDPLGSTRASLEGELDDALPPVALISANTNARSNHDGNA